MAEVSDLTTEQLETLVSADYEGNLKTLCRVLSKYVPVDDRDAEEVKVLKDFILSNYEIILASGNTAAVTADAILNP